METLDEAIWLAETMRDWLLELHETACQMKDRESTIPIEFWLQPDTFQKREEMFRMMFDVEIGTFQKLARMTDELRDRLADASSELNGI